MKSAHSDRIRRAFAKAAFLTGCCVALVTRQAAAQANLGGEARRQATRTELEQIARAAELASQNAPDAKTRERLAQDAASIRQRLQNGDFGPGDRIAIQVVGDSALTDTFTVRGDRVVSLRNLPDISLHGVLDSELEGYLTKEVAKYLRNPQLTATPLLRLAVMGAITKSGFMTVPVDQALADVIMAAGGPGQQSDFDKTLVRRSGKTIIDKKDFQEALRQNRTVGDMSLRDGDEIFVPDKKNSQTILQNLQIVSAVLSLYLILTLGKGGRGGGRYP